MQGPFTSAGTEVQRHLRLAVCWAGIGALTTVLAIPYELDLLSAKLDQAPLPLPIVFSLQAIQLFLVLLFVVWVGLRVGSKIGLDCPFVRAIVYGLPRPRWSAKRLSTAAALGGVVGAAIQGRLSGVPRTFAWKGLLISFYGGITEELLFRLFAMSLLAWIGWRLFERARVAPSAAVYWAANVTAALLFGASHLPAAATLWPLTASVVARVVIVNASAGVVFGAIFWQWGVEYAMVSHFFTDIVLHVIFAG